MTINKIIYWAATGPFAALMLGSATMYLFKTEEVKEIFTTLEYPSYLVIPLAIAKMLGVIAIISRWSNSLKEWAYAGFLIDFTLAFFAHYHANDGGHTLAGFAILFLLVSYIFEKRM